MIIEHLWVFLLFFLFKFKILSFKLAEILIGTCCVQGTLLGYVLFIAVNNKDGCFPQAIKHIKLKNCSCRSLLLLLILMLLILMRSGSLGQGASCTTVRTDRVCMPGAHVQARHIE